MDLKAAGASIARWWVPARSLFPFPVGSMGTTPDGVFAAQRHVSVTPLDGAGRVALAAPRMHQGVIGEV